MHLFIGTCKDLRGFVSSLFLCNTGIEKLLSTFPNDPQVQHMRDANSTIMHVLAAAYPCLPKHLAMSIYPNDYVEAIKHLHVNRQDPYLELELAYNRLATDERCAAIDCLQTRASLGRSPPRCAGCSVTPYCSRAYQKRSWRHECAPHREVCRVLAAATTVLPSPTDEPDGTRTKADLLQAHIPVQAAYQAMHSFAKLRDSKLIRLGKSYDNHSCSVLIPF